MAKVSFKQSFKVQLYKESEIIGPFDVVLNKLTPYRTPYLRISR